MYTVIFVITYQVASQALAISEVTKDLALHWDTENNCGPRPPGPLYPAPVKSTGNYFDHIDCDIIDDSLYISGYSCHATCQMDKSISVEISCNCHRKIGPIHFIKKCEWEYTSTTCPPLPADATQYNWECNPFTDICEPGQYDITLEAADMSMTELRKIETIIQQVEEMDFAYKTENTVPYTTTDATTYTTTYTTAYTTATTTITDESETTEQPTTVIPPLSLHNVIANVVTKMDTTPEATTKKTTTHGTLQPPGSHQLKHRKPAPHGPPPPSLPPTKPTTHGRKQRLPGWRRKVRVMSPSLRAMPRETEGDQLLQPRMLQNYPENDPELYPENYATEQVYPDFEDYEDYGPRARPVTNIVNFFNDGRAPEVIQRQTDRVNSRGDPAMSPYTILQTNMQNDIVQTEYVRAEESNDEAHHTERLQKRLGRFKTKISILEEKLLEQDEKHQALKTFIASNLKIEVDPDIFEIIK